MNAIAWGLLLSFVTRILAKSGGSARSARQNIRLVTRFRVASQKTRSVRDYSR